jgi:hypothetical protein
MAPVPRVIQKGRWAYESIKKEPKFHLIYQDYPDLERKENSQEQHKRAVLDAPMLPCEKHGEFNCFGSVMSQIDRHKAKEHASFFQK